MRGRLIAGILALLAVAAIVEAHAGRVELESACPQGTTFRVCLPEAALKD